MEESRRLIGIYPPAIPFCSLELWDEDNPEVTAVHFVSIYEVKDENGFRKECRVFVLDGDCRELIEVPGFHLISCDNCRKNTCTREPFSPHIQRLTGKPWKYDEESTI
jgi:hypothetical protein